MTLFKDAGYQMTVEILANVGVHVAKRCAKRMRTSKRARRILRGASFAKGYASGSVQKAKEWKRRSVVQINPEPIADLGEESATNKKQMDLKLRPMPGSISKHSHSYYNHPNAHIHTLKRESMSNPYSGPMR